MVVKDRELVLRRRVRVVLGAFMAGLLLSGLTAVALVTELRIVNGWIGEGTFMEGWWG